MARSIRAKWKIDLADAFLAVSIQIVGSALARDFEETIARERASYTIT
jgi:hypothetical protein